VCLHPDVGQDAAEIVRRDVLVDDYDRIEKRRERKEDVRQLPLEAGIEDVTGHETDAQFGFRR